MPKSKNPDNHLRPEFDLLKIYLDKLKLIILTRIDVQARHLNEIRDHLKVCDCLVNEKHEKIILFNTFRYWTMCRDKWSVKNSENDVNKIIPILYDADLTARDSVSDKVIEVRKNNLTTNLDFDPVGQGKGLVTQ